VIDAMVELVRHEASHAHHWTGALAAEVI